MCVIHLQIVLAAHAAMKEADSSHSSRQPYQEEGAFIRSFVSREVNAGGTAPRIAGRR